MVQSGIYLVIFFAMGFLLYVLTRPGVEYGVLQVKKIKSGSRSPLWHIKINVIANVKPSLKVLVV